MSTLQKNIDEKVKTTIRSWMHHLENTWYMKMETRFSGFFVSKFLEKVSTDGNGVFNNEAFWENMPKLQVEKKSDETFTYKNWETLLDKAIHLDMLIEGGLN